MKPEKVCIMIGACAVLNNIAIFRNEPLDGHAEADDQPDPICYRGPEDDKVIRDNICNTFCLTLFVDLYFLKKPA